MTARTAVVLFTRDLRVHDHDGLASAAATHERVAPLFVLDDAILRGLDAPGRLSFLLGALEDLRVSLRALGADLILGRGEPVAETLRVARAAGADTVVVGRDASAHARSREERLARACRRERLELRVAGTTSIVPPGALAPHGRDHYRVFTPYWRRWREAPRGPLAATPAHLRLPEGLVPGELPAPGTRGGESAGRRQLDRWLAGGLAGYRRDGDRLDPDASSRLGAYLHLGCVSARELAAGAAEHDGAEAFLRQLCWRDFFLQLLAANPQLPRDDLHPRGDAWLDDADALARWREGATGFPLVDAAMRQLGEEGWLPNRARLVAASFLTKTLYLDWRHGAAVFSRLLVDADLASNVGNWQWAAGTGADTRPNRVLDPVAQARRLDPDGAYVRRYVPELAGLAGPAVHEPWTAPRSARGAAYPAPIVERVPAHARFRAARRALAGPGGARA